MQDCGVGEAGLSKQAQQEQIAVRFDQLISGEGVRRQIISFAYSRGRGPVLDTSNQTLGLIMLPRTGNTN